jgi:hypothetical protein
MGLKKMAVVAAIVAPVFGFASAANAADAVALVGQGTITPGIPGTGCAPSKPHVTFGSQVGVAAGTDAPNAQLATVNFDGDSTAACASAASDSGVGTITGTATSATNAITWSRTGLVVTVSGPVTFSGGGHSILEAVCVFVPTSAQPTASYALACEAVLS